MIRPACAVVLALLVVPTLAQAAVPEGWYLAGNDPKSYEAVSDAMVIHGGRKSARLACISESKGFGTLMQDFEAANYLGKRIRLSAWLKVSDVKDWAGLWMRVDGASQKTLTFDNMQNRPLKGTKDWARYEVVLDVPDESVGIYLGVLVHGAGKLWLDDVQLEAVDRSVAVTDRMSAAGPKSKAPVNTDFER